MWSPNDKVRSPKVENEESNLLKYIIDVFCVKNIPLSLKCRQLLWDFVLHTSYRVHPQTPYLGIATGPHGDFSHCRTSFVESKILKLYSALSRVVSGIFNVEKYRDLEIWVRGHSRYHSVGSVWFLISVL